MNILDVLPYFLFLSVIMATYSFAGNYNSSKRIFNTPTIVCIILMSLFAGLRSPEVGTDTGAYIRMFFKTTSYELDWDYLKWDNEPGFYLLQHVVNIISSNYSVLLIVIALICYTLVLRSIRLHSLNGLLSLFIYITLGYYTFCFNAARQALALSIYMIAISYIIERKFIRYALVVIVASMFHKSIIIALPLYFLFRAKYSIKNVFFVTICGFAIATALPMLLQEASSIEGRYEIYMTKGITGGYLLTFFYTVLAIFFIFYHKKITGIERLRRYDVFLNMLICGSAIYLVVSLTGSYVELTRFAAYFQMASMFLFAEIYNAKCHMISKGMLAGIIVMSLVFFYIFVTTLAGLVPYRLNPTLFSQPY